MEHFVIGKSNQYTEQRLCIFMATMAGAKLKYLGMNHSPYMNKPDFLLQVLAELEPLRTEKPDKVLCLKCDRDSLRGIWVIDEYKKIISYTQVLQQAKEDFTVRKIRSSKNDDLMYFKVNVKNLELIYEDNEYNLKIQDNIEDNLFLEDSYVQRFMNGACSSDDEDDYYGGGDSEDDDED
jgi:hypothetical protein